MYKTMHNLRNRSKDKKGFTLAELLIVVAIIAVLVAIAIPVFTGQLEKAREAADLANIRAAYAEASLNALESDDGIGEATTPILVSKGAFDKVENKLVGGETVTGLTDVKGKTVTVTVNADATDVITFTLNP